jgi:hypothetical protein
MQNKAKLGRDGVTPNADVDKTAVMGIMIVCGWVYTARKAGVGVMKG